MEMDAFLIGVFRHYHHRGSQKGRRQKQESHDARGHSQSQGTFEAAKRRIKSLGFSGAICHCDCDCDCNCGTCCGARVCIHFDSHFNNNFKHNSNCRTSKARPHSPARVLEHRQTANHCPVRRRRTTPKED
ncbi:hypothetical protein BCR33DRAFT_422633 [Rhizoclosmatium globosum]|uniref:Uncharacterized protein n=1 Tax=Rhizoclosmatium globosum TaxID=329046 RepID=A0A1Y2BVQ7_9FUNG|nr:hypothetical protein BCR33DRAFT_422633 [Rhizoclosmatium globosum]|eukprot:ORY38868.1 hypothetical protein BCR33DRAFT_422633 [Rhizoclosmatium globosum]